MTRRLSPLPSKGAALLACVSCLVACNAEVADIGDDEGSAGASAGGGTETWVGYIELLDYFESGADRIELRSVARTAASMTGLVIFGAPDASPEIVPTDPTEAWGVMSNAFEGFEYSVRSATVEGVRTRFSINTGEHYDEWCAEQTSYAYAEGSEIAYQCLPAWNSDCDLPESCYLWDPESDASMTVDRVTFRLCGSGGYACACTAEACTGTQFRDEILFDLRFEGDTADGSVSGLVDDPHRVFLTRQ